MEVYNTSRLHSLFLLAFLFSLMAGCASMPESYDYNGHALKTHRMTKVNCNEPYQLTEDCSNTWGAKRKVDIGGTTFKVAGGENGTVIFLMNRSHLVVDPVSLSFAAQELERALRIEGIEVIDREAMMTSNQPVGLFLIFDGDAYSVVKERYSLPKDS